MTQDPKLVLQELKENIYRPIYFLQGEETFYIDEISDFIEKNCLEEAQKGFNQIILYGKDVDVSTILSNAKRFPMMSDRQVVIVKEAQDVKDLNKEAADRLIDYIKNPLASTILVFAHKNKVLDGRKALAKTLDKQAVLVTTKKLYDNQVPNWVQDFIKAKGHAIDQKAVLMVVESVGSDLAKISNELQKVIINFSEKTTITADHIQKYIGVSKDYNVFELQNALGKKDVLKVNRIINYFEKDLKNNPIIPIIALLYSYYSKVLLCHTSEDKSDRGIASLLGVNPFFVKDCKVAATNYPLSKVLKVISYIKEADLQSKGIVGGAMNEGQILKELTFKMMHT